MSNKVIIDGKKYELGKFYKLTDDKGCSSFGVLVDMHNGKFIGDYGKMFVSCEPVEISKIGNVLDVYIKPENLKEGIVYRFGCVSENGEATRVLGLYDGKAKELYNGLLRYDPLKVENITEA